MSSIIFSFCNERKFISAKKLFKSEVTYAFVTAAAESAVVNSFEGLKYRVRKNVQFCVCGFRIDFGVNIPFQLGTV